MNSTKIWNASSTTTSELNAYEHTPEWSVSNGRCFLNRFRCLLGEHSFLRVRSTSIDRFHGQKLDAVSQNFLSNPVKQNRRRSSMLEEPSGSQKLLTYRSSGCLWCSCHPCACLLINAGKKYYTFESWCEKNNLQILFVSPITYQPHFLNRGDPRLKTGTSVDEN